MSRRQRARAQKDKRPTKKATIAVKPSPRSTKAFWLLGGLLFAAVVFAYQHAWSAGYIWDDDLHVTNNPLLIAPDGLRLICLHSTHRRSISRSLTPRFASSTRCGFDPSFPRHFES